MRKNMNPGDWLLYGFLFLLVFAMLYPFWYLIVASLSDCSAVAKAGGIMFWPKGFTLENYTAILGNAEIVRGFVNSILITVIGTVLNLFFTMITAYALSKKFIVVRRQVLLFMTFTMYFGAGLIPTYLIVRGLGMSNTWLALWIPGLISAANVLMMRQYFLGMPEALEESARIDGANDFQILWRIIMPNAKPIIATITLFCAIAHWNGWFGAMIYIEDRSLYPMMLIARDILVTKSAAMTAGATEGGSKPEIAKTLRYAVALISTIPVLCMYPFVQKHFAKGIMIGAIKE